MQGIEIEKKYKINKIPENIEKYKKIEIEQAYLNYSSKPTIRIRKYNYDKYILSCKARREEYKDNLSICDEVELSLSQEAYENLKQKCDGKTIYKTRYIIPLEDDLNAEVDMFHDFFEGVCFAEIEFKSEEQANKYVVPNWIGEDISSEKRVKNSYMAIKAKDISEYEDLIIK